MSDILIKGMEMPTGDEMLCINIFSNGNVTNHFDLRCMPVATAVPVPPHGRPVVRAKWIYDHWCEFKCSNCGAWSKSEPYRGRENFCPNCGADMREEN